MYIHQLAFDKQHSIVICILSNYVSLRYPLSAAKINLFEVGLELQVQGYVFRLHIEITLV